MMPDEDIVRRVPNAPVSFHPADLDHEPTCDHSWRPVPVVGTHGLTVAWVYRCEACEEIGYGA